jgi:NAD+ kinase
MARPRATTAPSAGAPPTGPKKGEIRSVLIAADLEKEEVRTFLAELEPWLSKRVRKVAVAGDVAELVRSRASQATPEHPDLLLVLGGDGAILGAVRAFSRDPVPTLGINFGKVGFLSSTPASRWREALQGVLDGQGVLEPRMRLSASLDTLSGEHVRAIALNEVLIARGTAPGMLTLGLSVGGEHVADYRADGVIVASPSGSTAHSLSAGGPILFPSMLGMIVTPICPQGLSFRPIVLHPDSRLELVAKEGSSDTMVVIDGQAFHTIRHGEVVRIERHPVAYPLLAWSELDAYRRLRERLGWSEIRYTNGE